MKIIFFFAANETIFMILLQEMIKELTFFHVLYRDRAHFLQQQLFIKNDPVFHTVGLTIDVFYFNCKHSTADLFCQQNCNAAAYPELFGEGGKGCYFNSSIAKQINAWLGISLFVGK